MNQASLKRLAFIGVLGAICVAVEFTLLNHYPGGADGMLSSHDVLRAQPLPNDAVVKVIDSTLPHEKDKRAEYLWQSFACNRDINRFNSCVTGKWEEDYEAYAAVLLRKADELHLDSLSLRKSLDIVLHDAKNDRAYLPVAAYQARIDRDPIWIIAVMWNQQSAGKISMCHICIYAFNQNSLELMGYSSCM